jgi:hypothetical protein
MKRITFKSILLLVFISLVACGKGVTVNAGSMGDQRAPGYFRDQTNMRLCSGAPPKNASIMGETWMLTQTSGNLTVVQGLFVEDNQTTFTKTCSAPNLPTLTATVKASSTFSNSTLKHAAAPTKTVGAPRTGLCSTFLDANPSNYELSGSCLKITINGETHSYVRASGLLLDF